MNIIYLLCLGQSGMINIIVDLDLSVKGRRRRALACISLVKVGIDCLLVMRLILTKTCTQESGINRPLPQLAQSFRCPR